VYNLDSRSFSFHYFGDGDWEIMTDIPDSMEEVQSALRLMGAKQIEQLYNMTAYVGTILYVL
jgi:hypothetical protein